MGYIAVSGGQEAIEASIELLRYYRSGTVKDVDLEAIEHKMSLLVDRVMSEAGFYAKAYAALALKQCEGSVEEAVFLLRAYRSTLTREFYTEVADTAGMRGCAGSRRPQGRRGRQFLGATFDFTHP
jgi:alpha-D-ribose 1-methylphosphonate 5-triphosphate synthase subunit PhnI